MRAVVLCAFLCACRLNFDSTTRDHPDAAEPADTSDASGPACTATKVPGFSFGTGVTDLGAAELPDGYAVGAIMTQSSLFGVHLSPQLIPNTPTPFTTTPTPGNGMYTNASMWFDGTNLDGALTLADGTAYLKTFQPDMMAFIVAIQKTPGAVGEPSIAVAGGTALISTWFDGSMAYYNQLAGDGSPMGPDLPLPPPGTKIVGASAASGPAAVIVFARQGGTCDATAIGTDQTGAFRAVAPVCSNPYVHALGTQDVVVYEAGSSIAAVTLTATPTPNVTLLASSESTLVTGRRPKLFDAGGELWLSWVDTRLHVSRLASIRDATVTNLPAGLPDAYEPAGPTLFAVYGPDLWAITCP